MPITYRYSSILGFCTGFIHFFLKKKPSLLFKHFFIITGFGGTGLCYKELY